MSTKCFSIYLAIELFCIEYLRYISGNAKLLEIIFLVVYLPSFKVKFLEGIKDYGLTFLLL